jgi:hypothetical protein
MQNNWAMQGMETARIKTHTTPDMDQLDRWLMTIPFTPFVAKNSHS